MPSHREMIYPYAGTSRFVFARTIKKIYSKDRGQDIINVILDGPYCAIPIVLKRLVQKNEEWMRAQVDSLQL